MLALKTANVCSYGAFAHIAKYNPSAVDDTVLEKKIQDVTGIQPTALGMAYFNRLHFEAHAMSIADTKVRIEQNEDTLPRRLPAPERAARHLQQKSRLNGLTWSMTLEPSHRLLDKVQQQLEDNTASYISLDMCTCRQQELAGVKREPGVKVDPVTGAMRVIETETDSMANTSTDYLLRMAFRRRALAYDQTNLCTFENMELWTEKLFSALHESPPAGYSGPTRERILSADRQLFSKIIENCRDGVALRTDSTGNSVRPIESSMLAFFNDPTVIFNLLPLPSTSSSSSSDKRPVEDATEPVAKRRRGGKQKGTGKSQGSDTQAQQPYQQKGRGKQGKNSKGKGKGEFVPLPPSLRGCWPKIKGQRACIFFNMGTCNNQVAPGAECPQGVHLCMAPRCGEPHPAVTCPTRLGTPVQ